MAKERLDRLLVRRGLADSQAQALRIIMAGEVCVDGHVSDKPGHRVAVDSSIELVARPPFVSRGGEKLDAALARFSIDVAGWAAADVGASTGGFTDCLLQRGARLVYAIDVGYGQLDWGLRNDPRVVVMERTNARYVDRLPEPVDLVTVDASFISLGLILPAVIEWMKPGGEVVALIKPQFEAGRHQVEKGGVVHDPVVHQSVLERVAGVADRLDLGLLGLMPSPLRGPAGNVEFLGWWRMGVAITDHTDVVLACLNDLEDET